MKAPWLLLVPSVALAEPAAVNLDIGGSTGALISDASHSDDGGDDNFGSFAVFARGALPITSHVDIGLRPAVTQVIASNTRAWSFSGGLRVDAGSHVWFEGDAGVLLMEEEMDRVRARAVFEGHVGVRVTESIAIVGSASRWLSTRNQIGITPISIGLDYRFR
jgi:hypothetical protein